LWREDDAGERALGAKLETNSDRKRGTGVAKAMDEGRAPLSDTKKKGLGKPTALWGELQQVGGKEALRNIGTNENWKKKGTETVPWQRRDHSDLW